MKLFYNNKLISTDVKFCDGFYKIKGLMFSKKLKNEAILFVNKIFYNLVRFSLFFTSKKSTNIMMYVVEK